MKKFLFILLAMLSTANLFAAEDRIVSVRGEGEVKIKPDMAIMNLNVTTKAKDAKAAQEKNAQEMIRVNKIIKDDFKIESKDIQTAQFSLQPDYRYEQDGKRTFLGFNVIHSLTVKVKKLEKLGEIMDTVVGKGSENKSVSLDGITFDTEKRKEFELQALENAMNNARDRAEALAKFAKKSLNGVRRISDSNISYHPFMGQPRMAMAKAEMVGDSASTQIQAGEIVVNSQVSVEYDLN